MQPLFTAHCEYSLKEYRKFFSAIHKKIFKTHLRLALFCLFFLIIILFTTDISLKIGFSIGILLIPFTVYFSNRIHSKKMYRQMENLKSTSSDFAFYPDHLEITSSIGNTSLDYDKLFCIIETPTNFYIMLTKQQGSIVIKEVCSPELVSFIQNLMQQSQKQNNKK